MKKLPFLLIMLTTLNNLSYASFPVSDTLKVKQGTVQTETVEQYHIRMQKMGFDIDDCRCDDCKIFKGINTPLKNGEVKQKQKTNIWPLLKTLGIWFLAVAVILAIMLIVAIFNAFNGLSL